MSKIKIPTVKFQDMVSRATKGASENKLLPITSMICIQLKDNVLSLTTTDTANTLTVKASKVEGDDMYVVVPVKQFSTLIARSDCDSLNIDVEEGKLHIHGNGDHYITIPVDEDGEIRFPEYSFDKEGDGSIINLTSVKNILDINKASVADTIDAPCLCGYYVGDMVITTNEQTICINKMDVMNGEYLISPEMMELLSLSKQEKITWWYKDGFFLFETDDMVLYGAEHDEKDRYPVEDIKAYLDVEFTSHCRLPKIALQGLIDRLNGFIQPYDKNGANLTFTKEGVRITSKNGSSDEVIPYTESVEFAPFICCVDIPLFKSLIDANPDETVDLWYGNDSCIKMTSGKVTQVLALLEDEDISGNG